MDRNDIIDRLIADRIPESGENEKALSDFREEIRKRIAVSEERERIARAGVRRRQFEGGDVSPMPENASRGDAGAAESRIPQAVRGDVFSRYAAPDPTAAAYEGDRGDAFDGSFTEPENRDDIAGITEEYTYEELLTNIKPGDFTITSGRQTKEEEPAKKSKQVAKPDRDEPEITSYSLFDNVEEPDGAQDENAEEPPIRKEFGNEAKKRTESLTVRPLRAENAQPPRTENTQPARAGNTPLPRTENAQPPRVDNVQPLKAEGIGVRPAEKEPGKTPEKKTNVIRVRKNRKYIFPSLDLVAPKSRNTGDLEENYALENAKNAGLLKETLQYFGINVEITGITRGPTVTRFEFKPEVGVKISRVVALTDDIAMGLAASSVRMEAPIPGKTAIGIEIPNKKPSTVYIYDVLKSEEYKNAKTKLSVPLGKDIDGRTIVSDIGRLPHLLIAGSTGSGKSVCINTIIMGILFNATPEEVKFIMIDPKVVELGIYNNIPHLLIPVETEPAKASAALKWAVNEVERRYRLFAEYLVRDLAGFNRGIKERPEMAHLEKMPQIVIIIDELADLMLAAPQDVEKSIIKLAQKARAAGVHLIIATQRPSVDVITGIIKANIPSRIAFAVVSQFDSRTILDTNGAEKLLGRGDMLYHPLGATKSSRLQCAFVSDEEVENVVDFIRTANGAPEFDDNVAEAIEATVEMSKKSVKQGKNDKNQQGDEGEADDNAVLREAAELAIAQGCLTISSLQRRMKLGYNRAANIVETLEGMGLLSKAAGGSKPREVLLTREEWKARLKAMEENEE